MNTVLDMSAQSLQSDRWRKEPLSCPTCGTGLKKARQPDCVYYACPCCEGRSSTIALMRRFMPRESVNYIWQTARHNNLPERVDCPACRRRMARLPIPDQGFDLDVCCTCMLVWFDPGEYANMPKVAVGKKSAPRDLPPELKKQIAEDSCQQIRKTAQAQKKTPDDLWKYIPGVLGMPVEFDHQRFSRQPIVTWSAVLLIFMISMLAFSNLDPVAMGLGLIPSEFGRLSGFTFLTSFFIHGGLWHLAGNLYFLLIFGDNVEEHLGPAQFFFLLLLSTAGAGLLHVLMNPDSAIPCIGASGGISGIMAYYALTFPKTRIGFFFFIRWIRLPVLAYILFWVVLQMIGTQTPGSDVAYGAHLGGALTGLLFWLFGKFVRVRAQATP